MPMQPSPSAETSRPLFPKRRVCIVGPPACPRPSYADPSAPPGTGVASTRRGGSIVIVQIHTDNYIESNERLTAQVEALVASAVSHFAERVSRVQVHLGDENSSS